MPDLVQEIRDGMQQIVIAMNGLKLNTGDLASLSTTDKTSVVAAINENVAAIASVAASVGASIDDSLVSSAAHTWSINKILSEINSAIADLVDLAPEHLNTLGELSAGIQDNDKPVCVKSDA